MEKEKSLTQTQEEEIEDVVDYIRGLHFEDIKKQFFEDYPETEDSIGWVIKQHSGGGALDLYEMSNMDAKKCDIYIVYCKSCKRCWEKPHNKEEEESNILYYIDFPNYDREIEICPKCQGSLGKLTKEN